MLLAHKKKRSCHEGTTHDLVRDEPAVMELTISIRIEAVRIRTDLSACHDEGERVEERQENLEGEVGAFSALNRVSRIPSWTSRTEKM